MYEIIANLTMTSAPPTITKQPPSKGVDFSLCKYDSAETSHSFNAKGDSTYETYSATKVSATCST